MGGRSGTRESRSQERSKLFNILFFFLSSLLFPHIGVEVGNRKIRITRRPLIPLIRPSCTTVLFGRLLPSLSLFSSFSGDVELSREQSRTYPVNEGVVDLFMANWKRKLRGLQYRWVPRYFCPTVDPKRRSSPSHRFISAISLGRYNHKLLL